MGSEARPLIYTEEVGRGHQADPLVPDTVSVWDGGLLSLNGYRATFNGDALPYTPPHSSLGVHSGRPASLSPRPRPPPSPQHHTVRFASLQRPAKAIQ